MALCDNITLNGIGLGCETNMGGIRTAYVALRKEKTAATVTSGEVTAFAEGTEWYEYKFRKQSSGLNSEATIDDTTGVRYFTNTTDLVFAKQDKAKRLEMMSLFLAEAEVVVEDQNGARWYLGYDNPVTCTALTAATGTAFGDANQYTCTLSDMSNDLPYPVADTVVIEPVNV